MKRPIKTTSRLLAVPAIIVPKRNIVPPIQIILFLPKLSDNGPAKRVAIPIPTKKLEMMNCVLLGDDGINSEAMSGNAGSIASIENAISEKFNAIIMTNSPVDNLFLFIVNIQKCYFVPPFS